MKAFWSYAAVAVFVYLLSLLISFPAQNIYQRFEKQLYPIQLTGIKGSIWSGSASNLSLNRFAVSNISWQLSGWDLLFGDVVFSWKVKDRLGLASGVFSFHHESYQLTALQAEIDIQLLKPLWTTLPVSLAGNIVLKDVAITLSKDSFSMAQGNIYYLQAAVSWPYFIPLGDFSAELGIRQGGLYAKLKDDDAVIFLQGNIKFEANLDYVYQANISIRDATVSGLVEGLAALGRADNQGVVQVNGRSY